MSTFRFKVEVDDAQVLRALRESRKEMNRDVRDALLVVAERFAAPRARSLAPRIVRSSIIARATARDAYIGSSERGKKRRRFGLINFGGTVKSPIVPKKARALRMPDGRFVARVDTPRTHKGLHFLERAIRMERSRIDAGIEKHVTAAIRQRVEGM